MREKLIFLLQRGRSTVVKRELGKERVMPSGMRHVLRQSRRVGMETGSPANKSSCLSIPWGVFMFPSLELPPLKTTSLKDAEIVPATVPDRVPINAGGMRHFKDWFG